MAKLVTRGNLGSQTNEAYLKKYTRCLTLFLNNQNLNMQQCWSNYLSLLGGAWCWWCAINYNLDEKWLGVTLSDSDHTVLAWTTGRSWCGWITPYLLTLGGPVNKEDAKGKIIWVCNNVGELEFKTASKGRADSVDKLKACTMAETGCGSYVPEMKRLLLSC